MKTYYIKARPSYLPTAVGKWLYRTSEELQIMDRGDHGEWARWNHVGRIVKTDLGQRHDGDDRCAACSRNGTECWKYKAEVSQRIAAAGASCARCRQIPQKVCTYSKPWICRKQTRPSRGARQLPWPQNQGRIRPRIAFRLVLL